jgi:cleavage and polyadenylation specificity factor subunit 3
MSRLYHALRDKYIDPTQEAKNPKQYANSKKHHCRIFTPKNTETVKLYFRGDKVAKMVGDLAKEPPTDGQVVEGLVVGKDFQYQIMDPEELQELTGLPHSTLVQRLNVPFYANFSLLEVTLQKVFGSSCLTPALPEAKELDEMEDDDDIPASHLYSSGITVMGAVTIWDATDSNELVLEWEGSMENDMISDSVVGVIMSISTTPSPATVKLTRSEHSHDHSHETDATAHKEKESESQNELDGAKDAEIETKILKDNTNIYINDQSLESEDKVKTVIRFMSGYFDQVSVSESNPKHIDVHHPIGYSLPIDCNSLEVINLDKHDESKEMSISPASEHTDSISNETKQNAQTVQSIDKDVENSPQLEQEINTNPAPNGTSKTDQVEDEDEAKLNLSPTELEKLEFETKVKKILLMVKNAIRAH